MVWYEEEVKQREEQLRTGRVPGRANLFFGSSSFRLWTTLEEDMAGFTVANLAFGGSTLEACVHFFERLVVPAAPRSLLLYAGDNDIGDGAGVDRICGHLGAFLAKMDRHYPHIPFAFLSIKPSPVREHLDWQIRTVNRYAKERVQARENSRFIDVYTPMLDRRGRPDPTLFSEDGLHLAPPGYRLWTSIVRGEAQGLLL